MTTKIDEIDERSELVYDVIGQPPAWPIRWGSTLIFGIMAMGIFMSWVIRYPDTIAGQAQISTTEPPIRVVALRDAQIQELFVADGQTVQEGQHIAETKSLLSSTNILQIKDIIHQTETFVESPKTDFVLLNPNFSLGEMQTDFNNLQKDVKYYTDFLNDNYFVDQIHTLNSQINDYHALNGISRVRKGIKFQNLQKAKERFEAQKALYKDKVISRFDFIQEESNYNEIRQSFEATSEEKLQNSINITANDRQVEQLKFNIRERDRNLKLNIQQSLLNVKNQVKQWEQNNIFAAPISGKLSYLKRIVNKQHIIPKEELFAVVPLDSNYVAIVNVPTVGYGKVAVGQRVQIRLDNYPPVQFGVLVGRVRKLSYLASEKTYFAEVSLSNGLVTNYLKTLDYHPEMGGIAEIVTEDLSLLERLFYSIKDIFNESFSKQQV